MDSTLSAMQDLSSHVHDIEERLRDLDEKLRSQDSLGMEAASAALHKVLADALVAFRHAQQEGQEPLSPELRHRLMLAQTRVTGLQQSVHHAASTLQRTLGVLLVSDAPDASATYSSLGPKVGPGAAINAYRG